MSWFWSFAVSLLQTFQTFLNYLQAQLQSYAENYSSVHLDAHNLLLAAGSLNHCEDLRSESAQQGSGFERSWSTPLTAQRSWSKERPFHLKRKQEKNQAWTPIGNYNTTDMYWSWMVWLGRRISIQKNEPLPEHYLRPLTVWAFWNAWRILEEHTYRPKFKNADPSRLLKNLSCRQSAQVQSCKHFQSSSSCLLDTALFHCQVRSNPQGSQTVQSGKQIHNDLLVLGGLSVGFYCHCELEMFMMKSGRNEGEGRGGRRGERGGSEWGWLWCHGFPCAGVLQMLLNVGECHC